MLKQKYWRYFLNLYCSTDVNFYEDHLLKFLYMWCIGFKTFDFIFTKASFLDGAIYKRNVTRNISTKKLFEFRNGVFNENLNEDFIDDADHYIDGRLENCNGINSFAMQSFPCSSTKDDKDKKKIKKRPNYFVAFQITDTKICATVKEIQDHMVKQNEHLKRCMISQNTLHITLMVMHLGDSRDHFKAMKALRAVHQEFNNAMCNEPLKLEFVGMGNFGNRVLFVKVKENASYNRLCTFVECIYKHMGSVGIISTDTRKGFKPHLTIAKLDFSKKYMKGIKKIAPTLYEDFVDLPFGCDVVKSIQLLRMNGPKTSLGYYFGDELFFRSNEPTLWKKLNSLLAVAEKKKEIRDAICKITGKVFP